MHLKPRGYYRMWAARVVWSAGDLSTFFLSQVAVQRLHKHYVRL